MSKTGYASPCLVGLAVLAAAVSEAPHWIDGFRIDGTQATIRVGWREPQAETGASLEVYHASTLTSDWRKVYEATRPEGKTSASYGFPLPETAARSGFFRVETCADTDGDGLPDGWEVRHGLDPRSADGDDGPWGDPDWDAMPNSLEFLFGTDPRKADTDGDGLSDRYEAAWGLDPLDATGENGWKGDPDGDGLTNGEELELNTNPKRADTDGDGISDGVEAALGLDPTNPEDAGLDPDGDGLSNLVEIEIGTNPFLADSDGDGLDDGEEIEYGTDPLATHTVHALFSDAELKRLGCTSDLLQQVDGNGHTEWEKLFYPTNEYGALVIPVTTDRTAVLSISRKAGGIGTLKINGQTVPIGVDEWRALKVGLERNVRYEYEASPGTRAEFESEDFCIGEGEGDIGWIMAVSCEPNKLCIHESGEQSHWLMMSAGDMEITCTWTSSGGLTISPFGTYAATLEGNINRQSLPVVTGTVDHPQYMCGPKEFVHPIVCCSREEEEEDEDFLRMRRIGEEGYIGGWADESEDDDDPCGCKERRCNANNCSCYCHYDPEQLIGLKICREHYQPYFVCDPLHYKEYTKVMAGPKLSHVLKLRDPPESQVLVIKPPEIDEKCCDCPSHIGIGYSFVRDISYRLEVVWAGWTIDDSVRFEEETAVCVTGMKPSASVGDACLTVDRAGSGNEYHHYTILGVGIDAANGTEAIWPEGGVPMQAREEPGEGSMIRLRTDVQLSQGSVHLGLEATNGLVRIWYSDGENGYVKLLDSETKRTFNTGIKCWREMIASSGAGNEMRLFVTGKAGSDFELKFGFALDTFDGGVADEATEYVHLVGPRLVFDYDRNGTIDRADMAKARDGKTVFRFWINSDDDSGDVCAPAEYCSDCVWVNANHSDEIINGRRDLVDFTPVYLDLSDVFPEGTPEEEKRRYTWKIRSNCIGLVWTSLDRREVGSVQRTDVKCFGSNLDEGLEQARVCKYLMDSLELDPCFAALMMEDEEKGVFLIEGFGEGDELFVEGWLDGKKQVFEQRALISVSPVEKMYRWLGLRYVCGQGDINPCEVGSAGPVNRPDAECDGRNYVFVHGFNMNTLEARAMGSELFKRLWQSGLNSMYTVVDWFGNEDQFSRLGGETASLNYYGNALHAFETAPSLAAECNRLPGRKVMIGHSLGNMLVSSAAVDCGLDYGCYYMLNAAVAAEAYDSGAHSAAMQDAAWQHVKERYRVTGWHALFSPGDFRCSLSWRGRFAGLHDAVNCYSSTEEVLGDDTSATLTINRSVWVAQELLKGSWEMSALDLWPSLNIVSEGGWGINMSYRLNPYYYLGGSYNKTANELTREEVIKTPLFTSFVTEAEKMHSLNYFVPLDDAWHLRAQFLCDAIPATSHAAGMQAVKGLCSINMMTFIEDKTDYPMREGESFARWRHSDVKNVAYFWNYKLFDLMVREGRE